MTILVHAFSEKTYPQVIAGGKALQELIGGDLIATVIGHGVEELAEKVAKLSGSKVYLVDKPELEIYNPEAYARVLIEIAKEVGAKIILLESDIKGKILAGILSGKLECGAINDVIEFEKRGDKIIYKRVTYAGRAVAEEETTGESLVISVNPGAFKPVEESGGGEVVKKDIILEDLKVVVEEYKPKEVAGEMRLEDAEVVVGAGRGIRKQEDLEMIKELAKVLGGSWGVTRPLAADYGWAPIWIGISGVPIRPKLYIAVGISGQPQHTSGIRDSKIIVAINKDPDAPIFQFADYGIVGDAYQIVPELVKKLKELKG